jgi:hypothetical protein
MNTFVSIAKKNTKSYAPSANPISLSPATNAAAKT